MSLAGLTEDKYTCCKNRTISQATRELDGTYVLHDIRKKIDGCNDGCIYKKVGDDTEYCFQRINYTYGLTDDCSGEVGR